MTVIRAPDLVEVARLTAENLPEPVRHGCFEIEGEFDRWTSTVSEPRSYRLSDALAVIS